jgi:hypothetical protein
MQTAVIIQRNLKGNIIRQNSKTGFLHINDLYKCYVDHDSKTTKTIDRYWGLDSTKELLSAMEDPLIQAEKLNTPKTGELKLPFYKPSNLVQTKRGRNGGTWVHPYIFIDFAMWLSVEFKVWALDVISDKVLQFRDDAGEKYKEMSSALSLAGMNKPSDFAREAKMVNRVVFGKHKKGLRDQANEKELELLNKIQFYNAELINQEVGFTEREKQCQRFKEFHIKFYQ